MTGWTRLEEARAGKRRSEGQRRGEDKNGLITSLYETLRNASRRGESEKKEAGSNARLTDRDIMQRRRKRRSSGGREGECAGEGWPSWER